MVVSLLARAKLEFEVLRASPVGTELEPVVAPDVSLDCENRLFDGVAASHSD